MAAIVGGGRDKSAVLGLVVLGVSILVTVAFWRSQLLRPETTETRGSHASGTHAQSQAGTSAPPGVNVGYAQRRQQFIQTLDTFRRNYDPGLPDLDHERLEREAAAAEESDDVLALLDIAREGIDFSLGANRDLDVELPDYDTKNDQLFSTIEAFVRREEALLGTSNGGTAAGLHDDVEQAATVIYDTARGDNASQHVVNTLALADALASRHNLDRSRAIEAEWGGIVVSIMSNDVDESTLTPEGGVFLDRCRGGTQP
jgi:hypothetical protein